MENKIYKKLINAVKNPNIILVWIKVRWLRNRYKKEIINGQTFFKIEGNLFPHWNWTRWRRSNYLFLKEELKSIPDNISLLDLAAGPGQFKDLMTRFKRCAVDIEPYEGIDIVCDITKELPFKENTFDVIISSNVMEHVSEPYNVLRENFRALKKGGVLLGTIPFIIQIHQRPRDYYRYTDIGLEYLLKKSGFRDIEIKPILFSKKNAIIRKFINNPDFPQGYAFKARK